MDIKDLEIYRLSMELGEIIWEEVNSWNYFEIGTIGKQLVRACDSISANLSEGYGRYSFKENKQFCYYSRGSLYETKCWIEKANTRKLISKDKFEEIEKRIKTLGIKINNYIKTIG